MDQRARWYHGRKVTVFLCTSRTFGWTGLQQVLREWDAVELVGHAPEGQVPEASIGELLPDVIAAAADRQGEPVVPLVARLHSASPSSRIVVLGGCVGPGMLRVLRRAGSSGYLSWDNMTREGIYGCILAITSGSYVATLEQIDEVLLPSGRQEPANAQMAGLTEREWEVLRQLARDKTEAEVIRELQLTKSTMDRTVAALKDKLRARGLFRMGMWALAAGVVPDE
jgi:DNA-binding NarL/FixJ family response regulator